MQAHESQLPADAVFQRMRAYASDLERTSPPVFVGREAILDELRFVAERVASDNPRGMTRVVQGVPGAGKSSLCDEFMASVQGRVLAGRRVLCAKLDPSNLAQPPLEMVNKLTDSLQVMCRQSVREICTASHGLTAESDLGACVSSHARRLWPKDALVVLAFDEMQECPATARSQAALRILNECLLDARILVVCFGLQNTETVLHEDLKLSRIPADAVTDIGPLAGGEGRDVLERTLDYFGATTSNEGWLSYLSATDVAADDWRAWRKDLLADLEDRTGDFPQHLTAALRATCQALCQRRKNPKPTAELTPEIVERLERNKADYYGKRIGDELRLHRTALGALARAVEETGGVALRDALACFMVGDDVGRTVDGERAERLMRLAVARGVLGQADVDGVLCCVAPPTPSMTRHLRDHYERMLAREDAGAMALAEVLETGRLNERLRPYGSGAKTGTRRTT